MLWDQFGIVTDADLSATETVNHINALRGGKAVKDDLTTNNTTASRVRLAVGAALVGLNPRLISVILRIIEPDIARLGGSHHQKVLVVRRGALLVAYCGGIDMNPNRVRVVEPGAGHPHHDTHCRIVGPSAHDLLSTFLSRWQHYPGRSRFGALRGDGLGVPAAIASPGPVDAPFGGPVSVMIARTFNPVNLAPPLVVAERAIKPALLAAIASAQRFIYCEDQYLFDLDTARALIARLPQLDHVTILIPGNPLADAPFSKEYRRDFVALIDAARSGADRAKLGVFQLTTSQSAPTFGDHTYVHSKSWVFDDELAVIGTANCNRRSYTFDSEVDAFIFEDDRRAGDARETFAQRYRMALWQHHLGVSAAAVSDGVRSAQLWRAGTRPASARVIEFDHTLPTGFTSTAGLRQAVMDRAAERLRGVVDPTI
ncbi:phospholipase D-like domain-containing protein [Sphingomonas sp. PB4P5]|uniref:phospholipase D-like domain-containing protein n=1 Tax=Parasphingomonas puruogangriensis TaxID=3096155 RepID=UPI003FA732CB